MVLAARAENATQQKTVITSDTLSFDYDRLVAVFEDNVTIIDPQVRMKSKRLNVLFDEANQIKSVTASGNVRMWQGDRTATCRRAIYVARTGEMILHGDAIMRQGKDSVTGDEITIMLNENKMVCKPATLVIYPGEGQKSPLPDVSGRDRSPRTAPASRPGSAPGTRGDSRLQVP